MYEDIKEGIKLTTNKHSSRRIKHADVKHHLVRGVCDGQKVRVVYVKSIDVQRFHKHAKAILNDVSFDYGVGV